LFVCRSTAQRRGSPTESKPARFLSSLNKSNNAARSGTPQAMMMPGLLGTLYLSRLPEQPPQSLLWIRTCPDGPQ
jgi:hypothetical protein